ncbi:MAG: hypothetical protein AAGA60_07440 [Cyanobacteria bacterium P01_E01_bin.42]
MSTQPLRSQDPIQRVIEEILASRKITREDQNILMSLLFDGVLGDTHQHEVNRIYEAVSHGFIRVVD